MWSGGGKKGRFQLRREAQRKGIGAKLFIDAWRI